jgi:hypothetical protein
MAQPGCSMATTISIRNQDSPALRETNKRFVTSRIAANSLLSGALKFPEECEITVDEHALFFTSLD